MHGGWIDARRSRLIRISKARWARRLNHRTRVQGGRRIADVRPIRSRLTVSVAIRAVCYGVRESRLPMGNPRELPAADERAKDPLTRSSNVPQQCDGPYVPAVEIRVTVVQVPASPDHLRYGLKRTRGRIKRKHVTNVVQEMRIRVGPLKLHLAYRRGAEAPL